jgi:DNA repair exonuclease SbcCD ATPase subunit
MKVIRLTAENIKRLRAVEITPEGNVVIIAGRNAQGKTSVLDAIWFALGGGAATKDTPKPIRDGEDEASVELDLGDFVVTRTWKGDKTTLAVMSKDGAKYPSPQTFLDEKLGALSFDPLEFAQQDDKTQLATLLRLVELPFDVDELAMKRRGVYDQRTEVGRDLKAAEAQLAALPEVPHSTPPEEVSTEAIIAEQESYEQALADYQAAQRTNVAAQTTAEEQRQRVATLEAQLEQAREVAAQHFRNLVDEEKNAASIVAPERVDLAEKLATVEATNAAVRARRDHEKLETGVLALRMKQQDFTDALDAIDTEKSTALAAAVMPIEGLAFDDEGVTYGGVPFKQCSAAEQLRVSLAMAMSLNPAIRVIRISDGSLLDSENMAVIAEMAEANDFQCWIERVDESGQIGFVIEDGSVVGG